MDAKAIKNLKLTDRPKVIVIVVVGTLIALSTTLGKKHYESEHLISVKAEARIESILRVPRGVYLNPLQSEQYFQLKRKFANGFIDALAEETALLDKAEVKTRMQAFETGWKNGARGQKLQDVIHFALRLKDKRQTALDQIDTKMADLRMRMDHELNSILSIAQQKFLAERIENPNAPWPQPPMRIEVLNSVFPDDEKEPLTEEQIINLPPKMRERVPEDGLTNQ